MNNKEYNPLSRRNMAWLALLTAAILALSFAASAFAADYTFEPYETLGLWCGNCTMLGIEPVNYVNETLDFTCTGNVTYDCDDYNSTCKIEKDLMGGQVVINKVPPCDINITCQAEKYGMFQDISYPTYITVKKDEGQVRINIEVFDYNGVSTRNWTTTFQENSTVDQTDKFEYICQHEVITDVNMQTCAPFFEEYAEGQDILTYESIMAMTDCFEQLINVESVMLSSKNDHNDCKVDLAKLTESNDDCHARLADQEDEHKVELDDLDNEYRIYRLGTVSVYWMYFAFFLGIVIVVMIGRNFIGGDEFSG